MILLCLNLNLDELLLWLQVTFVICWTCSFVIDIFLKNVFFFFKIWIKVHKNFAIRFLYFFSLSIVSSWESVSLVGVVVVHNGLSLTVASSCFGERRGHSLLRSMVFYSPVLGGHRLIKNIFLYSFLNNFLVGWCFDNNII